MKTVKNLDAMRRLALAKGGELVVNGRPFNSSRQQIKTKAKPAPTAAPTPAPTPPEKPTTPADAPLTRAEMAKLLDERDSIIRQDIQHLHTLLAQVLAGQQGAKAPAPTAWRFEVEQDAAGAIKGLVAKPDTAPAPATAHDADDWGDTL